MTALSLRTRMLRGDILAGTFLKTPSHELVEIFAMSGMDFIALDAEHAPFDRARTDACLAVARALDFPVLVRVPDGTQAEILKVMDCGATGIIIPHVATPEKARDIAKWSRFGYGGRGYAGSTRWAGFTSRTMPELLKQSAEETIVIAQIEEPEGVDAIDAIAATEGLDGVFVGPADLAVCLGKDDPAAPEVRDAMGVVGASAKRHGRACMTFIPNTDSAAEMQKLGMSMFFVGSEQSFVLSAARDITKNLHALDKGN
ncbi:MAG: aldolase [Rhodospirillaceae bacterium]|nr:aldolase [Rhodospirillaceae bacterium]